MYARDFQLKPYNTFGLPCIAKEFFSFNDEDELISFIKDGSLSTKKRFVLGGGSNILFREAYNGIILHPLFEGIKVEETTDDFAEISVGAGVVWDDFVSWAVEHGYYGAENLSLIPGMAGAAPVQNIGAYGCEAKDIVSKVRLVMLDAGSVTEIDADDCRFGYRDSIFKHELKNLTVVSRVFFRLSKQNELNVTYGDVASTVESLGGKSLKNVRKAIIQIRRNKLPDPAETGNAGSFFKNPVVNTELFEALLAEFPDMPGYRQKDGTVKLAAGWLIERCGWKGKSKGDAGVHHRQALVLVNYGNATGNNIIDLAQDICLSVKSRFGIEITPEVEII